MPSTTYVRDALCSPPTRQPNMQLPHCVESQPSELRAMTFQLYPSDFAPRAMAELFSLISLSSVDAPMRRQTASRDSANACPVKKPQPDSSSHSSSTSSGVRKHDCQLTVVPPPIAAPASSDMLRSRVPESPPSQNRFCIPVSSC